MLLMIWVNDFWTLQNIPKWLKHAAAGEDYLGFSDLIFPWFLFALGMAIPFSFESRTNSGETPLSTFKHIFFRTIALLAMGLFHMNMEMYNHDTSIISKPVFVIICTLAFFIIWNRYPKTQSGRFPISRVLPALGVAILLVMFLIYKGKSYDGSEISFSIHWWGILGLIGWCYLITASVYFIFKGSISIMAIAFFVSISLNAIASMGITYNIFSWQSGNWIPGNGGLQALTFGGIITSLLLKSYGNGKNTKKLYSIILALGSLALVTGLLLRSQFIINKINGTPTWVLVSLSSSLFLFVLLHWLTDIKGIVNWYRPIKTAGTATLVCYLVPYLFYSFITILGIKAPVFLSAGLIGLSKSMLYSFIIIGISWSITRIKIQLKI